MPHLRNRATESLVRKYLGQIACVGLVGMRQVGKSTLLKKLAKRYVSFDLPETILEFERAGQNVLSLPVYPLAIDEAQKHPPVFDRLKYAIDGSGRTGRYLISGSVRFASRKQIRESLTGRIIIQEMFPLSLAECYAKQPSSFLLLAERDKDFLQSAKKRAWATLVQISHFLRCGGLPGICFKRDAMLRNTLFSNHIDTLLSRDIFLIRQIKLSPIQLRAALVEITKNQGLPTSIAALARVTGCAQPTMKTVLEAFEGLFVIRRHGHTHYIEDAGLSNYLAPMGSEITRFDIERAVYHELRIQISLGLNTSTELTHYRTRGGIDIPFFIKRRAAAPIAIAIDATSHPSDKNTKGMTWLKKRLGAHVIRIILCNTDVAYETEQGVLVLPWIWIF